MASDVTPHIRAMLDAALGEAKGKLEAARLKLTHHQLRLDEAKETVSAIEQIVKDIELFMLNNPEPPTPDENQHG